MIVDLFLILESLELTFRGLNRPVILSHLEVFGRLAILAGNDGHLLARLGLRVDRLRVVGGCFNFVESVRVDPRHDVAAELGRLFRKV